MRPMRISSFKHLTGIRRLLVSGLAAFAVLTASLAILWLIDPVAFRLFAFQPIREVRFFFNELGGTSGWSHVRRVTVMEPEQIAIEKSRPNEIKIVADLYESSGIGTRAPGIVLLHGSSPYGRKAGLIRLLGSTFQQRGWVVLAPDARGYGDTDDPVQVNDAAAWAVGNDVRRVLDYITGLPEVDVENIFVLGHSVGAGHALEAALNDERVKGLILIGPARHLDGSDSTPSLWTRVRFSADRRLEDPVPGAVLQASRSRTNIVNFASGALAYPGHIPLLVIDGEWEGAMNLEYLRNVVGKISPPIQYRTLSGTGHYCGVRSFFGSSTIYFRSDLFESFVQVIDDFLEVYIDRSDPGEVSIDQQDSLRR